MIIYPAIDLLDGKCVRLSQGNYDKVTVYSENPAEFSAFWTSKGAGFIHVVDLNGARTGRPVNDDVLVEIVKKAGVPVQVGGGIRSMERISKLTELGIQRVILGTAAVNNREFTVKALKRFGDRIVIGIDARDGFVAVDGWENKSSRKAMEAMASSVGCSVIASGGVSSIEDLINLKQTGVSGVITGRALYENRFDLSEAISRLKED